MKLFPIATLAPAALLVASGLASAQTAAEARPLRVGLFQAGIERTSLDSISTYQQIVFLKQVGQTLIENGPLGEVLPGLASSWTISADAKTYSFKLRKARFHDGVEVTGADVVYSLRKALGSHGNVASYYMDLIDGPNGISSPERDQVEIRLRRPYSPLLTMLSSGALVITHTPTSGKEAPGFVGTGPYKIVARDGVRVRLKAFDGYAGAYPPKLQDAEAISDADLANVVRKPSPDELPDYEVLAVGPRLGLYDEAKYERVSSPAMVTGAFFVNPRIEKYHDRAARVALLGLFQRVVDQSLFKHPGRLLTDLYPMGMIGHQDDRASLVKLRRELAKAPPPPKDAKICVNFHTMVGAEGAFHDAIAKAASREVTFTRSPFVDAVREWQTYDCDAFFMTWQSVFLDPEAGLVVFRILQPFTDKATADKFRKISDAASAEAAVPARTKLYAELADLVFKEAVMLPVFQPDHVEFLGKDYARGNSAYRYQQMISEIYRK